MGLVEVICEEALREKWHFSLRYTPRRGESVSLLCLPGEVNLYASERPFCLASCCEIPRLTFSMC